VCSKDYFIPLFAFTPMVNDLPAISNVLTKAIQYNTVNTGREMNNHFEYLCKTYGVSEEDQKKMSKSLASEFKEIGHDIRIARDAIEKILAKNEKKMIEEYQRRLVGGERSVMHASYYLSRGLGNRFRKTETIEYLKNGLEVYASVNRQSYKLDIEDKPEHLNIKSMLLRNKPVFLKSVDDQWLVICGFQEQVDDVMYLIYNPQSALIFEEKGTNCKIFQLEDKYCPRGDGKRLMNQLWHSEYRIYKSRKFPPCATTISLGAMHNDGWKAVYIYDFELKNDLLSDFEKRFKDYLKDLD
ncbi:MAG: hypothetical protein ACRC37_07810, partial [Lentisphaeria bacterium]